MKRDYLNFRDVSRVKSSELVQAWEHFLLRNGSSLAFIETHEPNGEIVRGEISEILIKNETLTIRTKWTARRAKDSNHWRSFPDEILYHILGEYASEPHKQDDGRVYFKSDFRKNYLYPAGHTDADDFKP